MDTKAQREVDQPIEGKAAPIDAKEPVLDAVAAARIEATRFQGDRAIAPLEEKIQLTGDDSYYFHLVDRWPDTGAYGEGRYIHIAGAGRGRYVIDSVDANNMIIFAHKTVTINGLCENVRAHIAVGDTEPSWTMFMGFVGAPWDYIYKEQWRDSEDYSDYAPIVYKTFADLAAGRGEFYNLRD